MCRTDHLECCNNMSNASWTTPNKTAVSSTRGDSDFYTDTGAGFIRLNLIRNTTTAAGEYCCLVPVEGEATNEFCIELFVPSGNIEPRELPVRLAINLMLCLSCSWLPCGRCCGGCYCGSVTSSPCHHTCVVVPEVSV